MAQSNTEADLRCLINNELPAVNTAGCRFSPVAGLTGESWRIVGEGIQLLARQQTQEKMALGVSRRREARILKRCAQDLGPRVGGQTRGWLIVEWLVGETLSEPSMAELRDDGDLALLIARLHRRRLSGYRLDLPRQFVRYWQCLDRRRITPTWLRWQRYFMRTRPPQPLMLAPLHMDIHPGNLLRQGALLRLIDWEYATDGDIALELAALFRANHFTSDEQQRFLRHYVQHGYRNQAVLDAQIERWLPWVDYLMLMWCEVRWQQSGDREFLRWGAALYQRFCLSSSPVPNE